jgi:poly-gamma-glutamate synthesis protein (capsule biosynthesis protein)
MANFPAKPLGNMSSIARFTLAPATDGPNAAAGPWTVRGAEFLPQWSRPGPPFRVVNVDAALADPALDPATRAAYEDARRRIREAVLSRGAADQGLTEPADGR